MRMNEAFKALADPTRREAQQIYYALNTTVVEDLMSIFWDLFSGARNGGPKESKP
jgi:hypothetical protein